MILYSYFRSSSAYRVRIGLNLKKQPYETVPIHLVKNGGEQHSETFKVKNKMAQVPVLDHNGFEISQSMAILQYVDNVVSSGVTLFPEEPIRLAQVMEFCEIINSGIQPVQNLSVLQGIEKKFQASKEDKAKWVREVIYKGFLALESKVKKSSDSHFCFGGQPTAADCFLIPQVYNALRYELPMEEFPRIMKVNAHCLTLDAFQLARPEAQEDCPEELRL